MAFSSGAITSTQLGRSRYARPNGNDVRGVVIHHMAGYFQGGLNQGLHGDYVAHFYIGDNQCVNVIPTYQQGWHAANTYYNNYFVGIEHANISLAPNWQVSEQTLRTSARLIADLSRYYGWGTLVHGKNVFTHAQVSQQGTECPGPFMKSNLNRLISMANDFLRDGKTSGGSSSGVKSDGSNLPINNNIKVGQFQARVNVALNIREQPNEGARKVGMLNAGNVITVSEQRGPWGRINDGGAQRWVFMHNDYTTPINRGPNPGGKPNGFSPFVVQVTTDALNVRKSATTSSAVSSVVRAPERFTIVEVSGDWGRLKSGAGWIHLGYTKRV